MVNGLVLRALPEGSNGCNGYNPLNPLIDKRTEDYHVYSQEIPEGIRPGKSGVFVFADDSSQELSLRAAGSQRGRFQG